MTWWILAGTVLVVVVLVAVHDIVQTKHAIIRNFPVVGHFRYWLEAVGPVLRQYIVTNNDEERPFSRAQRRWAYASSKRANSYFGFGTDNDRELAANYIIIRHAPFPLSARRPGDQGYDPDHRVPCAKVLGAARGLEPTLKPHRLANYVMTLRKELDQLAHACGVEHPALVSLDQIDILDDRFRTESARNVFGYPETHEALSEAQRDELVARVRRPSAGDVLRVASPGSSRKTPTSVNAAGDSPHHVPASMARPGRRD